MKVAHIGNMNNNGFVMMRYLRDRGIDMDLFLCNDEFEHFHPRNDIDDLDPYLENIKQLTWGDEKSFFLVSSRKIKKSIEGYDLYIGCGGAPAFFHKIGLKLDIFTAYGGDIHYIPTSDYVYRTWSHKTVLRKIYSSHQIKGINESQIKVLTTVKDYEFARPQFGDIFTGLMMPLLYVPDLLNSTHLVEKSSFKDQLDKIRSQYDLVIVNNARQTWKIARETKQGKGNDKLIKGYASFLKKTELTSILILFEYGKDVDASKELIQQLGIEKHVHWMPHVARKDLLYSIEIADIAVNSLNSRDLGSAGFEVMTMGKPLFSYIPWSEKEYGDGLLGRSIPPIINVHEPEDVLLQLLKYEKDPEDFMKIGAEGKDWVLKNMGEPLIDRWVYLINCLHTSKSIDMNRLLFNVPNPTGRNQD